jgi:hypothetical protein
MADLKISALTASTVPLAGTEVLPIVQSGTTKQVSVANLTAGRAVSASQLSSTTKVSGKIASSGSYNRIYEILASGGSAIGEISYNDTNDTMRIANLSNYVNTSMTFYVNAADRMEIMPNGDIKALNGNFVVSTSGKGIDFSATSGSGTSELLADYEEGTWTPTQGAGLTVVGAFSSSGNYVKIGKTVFVTFTLSAATSISAIGVVELFAGLPYVGSGVSGFGLGCNASGGATYNFQVSASGAFLEGGNISATNNLYGSVTYLTT